MNVIYTKEKESYEPGSVYPRLLAALTTWLNGFPSSTSLITYPNVPTTNTRDKNHHSHTCDLQNTNASNPLGGIM
jgi:hypothetical protein